MAIDQSPVSPEETNDDDVLELPLPPKKEIEVFDLSSSSEPDEPGIFLLPRSVFIVV